jgi:hypothetical protein
VAGPRAYDLGFKLWQGQERFLYSKMFSWDLGPTQPPMYGVPRVLLLGVKGLGHEADHSSLSSAQVKNK